ncbi:hypothetical protein CDD83_1418 [Cordyceps sp. RAO-2017]|nr:hypothetical protein CDD83_1418 [Cordyceps sp. RAO-2017]
MKPSSILGCIPPLGAAAAQLQMLRYGNSSRQVVGVLDNERSQPWTDGQLWLVYIHGGAWRTAEQTGRDFEPAIDRMLQSPGALPGAVRGFASIDYRLSPCAEGQASCPPGRRVRHPDHIRDVRSALRLLAERRGLHGGNYVLIGHSAGATLAFQLLMGAAALEGQPDADVPLPRALIGIAGIYDLNGLNDRYADAYADFMTAAFGRDRRAWDRASPARFAGSYRRAWPGAGHGALLAHSAGDSLVDAPEHKAMAARLAKDGVAVSVVDDLEGEHDFVWEDGRQIVRLVAQLLGHRRALPGTSSQES